MSAQLEQPVIEGSKGKGGSGGGAKEAPNTLASRAVVKVVEVLSEGQIEGLAGGAKGIYINDTPLQNADGSYNFARAAWDYRVGLPDQDYMQGFSDVEAEFVIGTTVTTSTSFTRSSSATNIDAVRVTISLPQGLYKQNTSNGNLSGTKVEFAIDTKLTSSGTWVQFNTYAIDGKTTSATEKQYRINRPAGSGTWDIRVRRLTADSAVTSLRNQIAVARVTEVQDIKLPYNDTAYVGLAIDAESVGNQIPRRSYLVKGLKVKVPSNYNPTTRVYTGIWNGTFNVAWTDNPAWVLYDLLTHPRYGMGEFISESQVEKFSFYDAAVYNDGLVDDGDGGTEPRFTFNAPIRTREEAFRLLTLVAGAMRAQLIYANGQVHLLQDRPADPVKLVTKANVINGKFDYRSTGLLERHTAFNVAFNDREDRHLERITTIDASTAASAFQTMLEDAQDRYGYNPIDITAFGATKESQAIRQGMWALDTELNQTELVQFQMSLNGFDLAPGDIIKLWDEDYTATRGGGRIVSVVGTTVTLDRPVTLVVGSKIDVLLADGFTIEQRNIVETTGTTATFTVASAFSQAVLAGADYIVTTAAAARQFRIMGIRQEEAHIVSVEGLFHDPNKYSRVEDNVNLPAQVFTTTKPTVCNAPTGLTFREIQVNDASEGLNGLRRSLLLNWVAPTQGIVKRYAVRYRLGNDEWTTVEPSGPSYEINPAFGGTYEVDVAAISTVGNVGPAVSGFYTVDTTGGGASTLDAPTSLMVLGGGTTFGGVDINFQWTNPSSNADVLSATLRDFEVRFIETVGSTTVRTVYYPAVAAGSVQTASYTYAMNTADGGPRRSVQVEVRCRDASNNLSNPVTATFTNPAPVAVTPTVNSGYANNTLKWAKPADTDLVGFLVWGSTTNGFTPGIGNLISEGDANYLVHTPLADATTWYYKVAGYDAFGKDYSGTGLNVSTQVSGTTALGAVTTEYMLTGVTWKPNDPSTNQVSWTAGTMVQTLGGGSGATTAISAGNATWSSGILYIYWTPGSSTLSSTTSLATAVGGYIMASYRGGTNLEAGDGRAYQDGSLILAGTVGATQVVSSGLITSSAQINNAVINDAHFTGLLTAAKIDGRELAIKDAAGNVILSSGSPLPQSYASQTLQNNLMDASWWRVGASMQWPDNDAYATTDFVAGGSLPGGGVGVIMRATATGSGAAGGCGGWNPGGVGNWFAIDKTKTYMFACYFYKGSNGTAAGTEYFGVNHNDVCNLNTTTVNGNPYFDAAVLTVGRWYLFVGKVFPYGSTGNSHTGAGVYDCTTGAQISSGTNYNWANATTATGMRAYQFYSNSGVCYFANPQVHLCNGSEPGIDALIAGGSVSGRNPITGSNVSTYIDNAAINIAHINTASIGSLSALSATMGSVHGGTFHAGSYTGSWAWPASGDGFLLHPNGMLWGNYNTGPYLQILANGDLYSNNFNIVGGNATFSGAVTATSFSGQVINTANIVGAAISRTYSGSSSGTSVTVSSISVPSGARSITAMAFGGTATDWVVYGGYKDSSTYSTTGAAYVELSGNASGAGYGSAGWTANDPSAGTYSITATRSGGTSYSGNIVLVVLVTLR